MDTQILDMITRVGREFGHKHIRRNGLSDTEFLLCAYIYTHPYSQQEQVVRVLNMDKTTVAKALKSLELKGVLIRTQDELDHRRRMMTVTEDGEKLISDIVAMHAKLLRGAASALKTEQQEVVFDYLHRILDNIEALSRTNVF